LEKYKKFGAAVSPPLRCWPFDQSWSNHDTAGVSMTCGLSELHVPASIRQAIMEGRLDILQYMIAANPLNLLTQLLLMRQQLIAPPAMTDAKVPIPQQLPVFLMSDATESDIERAIQSYLRLMMANFNC